MKTSLDSHSPLQGLEKKSQKNDLKKTNTSAQTNIQKNQPIEPASAKSDDSVQVTISSRDISADEKTTYSPEEVRAKAKAFLKMGTLPPEQATVLNKVLKQQEEQAAKEAVEKAIGKKMKSKGE